MYERLGLRADQIDDAGRIWERAYDGIATTELFPGVRESLERLDRLGLPLGLVTAGPSVVVGPQIERLGLARLLRIRVYGDDLVEQKPDPAPLRLALQRLGLDRDPGSRSPTSATRPTTCGWRGPWRARHRRSIAPDDARAAARGRRRRHRGLGDRVGVARPARTRARGMTCER